LKEWTDPRIGSRGTRIPDSHRLLLGLPPTSEGSHCCPPLLFTRARCADYSWRPANSSYCRTELTSPLAAWLAPGDDRLLKGGDPAAPSGTATLLRLHPSCWAHLGHRRPYSGSASDFRCTKLKWCDGRCVQGPGTYSPQYADLRLLATPSSCRRVAACNLN
jgi:hypothetical protein